MSLHRLYRQPRPLSTIYRRHDVVTSVNMRKYCRTMSFHVRRLIEHLRSSVARNEDSQPGRNSLQQKDEAYRKKIRSRKIFNSMDERNDTRSVISQPDLSNYLIRHISYVFNDINIVESTKI